MEESVSNLHNLSRASCATERPVTLMEAKTDILLPHDFRCISLAFGQAAPALLGAFVLTGELLLGLGAILQGRNSQSDVQ